MVGQAPPRTGCPDGPLSGRAALAHLAELAGVPRESLLETERYNLLDAYPGPHRWGKGDDFPAADGRRAAELLLPFLYGRRVLLLGRNVATAFRAQEVPFLEWREPLLRDLSGGVEYGRRRLELTVFPHPSRVSRWWNDEGNRRRAGAFLREALGVPS